MRLKVGEHKNDGSLYTGETKGKMPVSEIPTRSVLLEEADLV